MEEQTVRGRGCKVIDLKPIWNRKGTVGRHLVSHCVRFNVYDITQGDGTLEEQLSLSVSVYVTYPSYDGERQTLHHTVKVHSFHAFKKAVDDAIVKRDTWLQFVEAEKVRITNIKNEPVRVMLAACVDAAVSDVERVRLKYGKVNVMWTNKLPFQIL